MVKEVPRETRRGWIPRRRLRDRWIKGLRGTERRAEKWIGVIERRR